MRTKTVSCLTVLLMGAVTGLPALAQGGGKEALYVRSLAASCANCHGTDGKAVQGSAVTALAGLDKNYFIAQMQAFKAGTRSATVMHQISKGFSNGQVAALGAYFADQRK